MKVGDDVPNSLIERCISEYVRLEEHRQILREKWFGGMTLEELAGAHSLSLSAVKKVVYGTGDKVLLRAERMQGAAPAQVVMRPADYKT